MNLVLHGSMDPDIGFIDSNFIKAYKSAIPKFKNSPGIMMVFGTGGCSEYPIEQLENIFKSQNKIMDHKQANETVGKANPFMDFYVGSKEILARPMNRRDYNQYRGWELPADENGDDEGFLVEYLDGGKSNDDRHMGYISWSPSSVFHNAYKKNGQLTFGAAIEALKKGKMVQRSGWNGKGMFIFMQVPSKVNAEIVPKMTSLPESVKNEFNLRLDIHKNANESASALPLGEIKYQNQIAIVYPDNNIYGWVASPSDILEEDWIILD